jgi:hypothetical protein
MAPCQDWALLDAHAKPRASVWRLDDGVEVGSIRHPDYGCHLTCNPRLLTRNPRRRLYHFILTASWNSVTMAHILRSPPLLTRSETRKWIDEHLRRIANLRLQYHADFE